MWDTGEWDAYKTVSVTVVVHVTPLMDSAIVMLVIKDQAVKHVRSDIIGSSFYQFIYRIYSRTTS